MSKQPGMVYLGICGRLEPPLIGIYYKNRDKDDKKKVYTILLQRLVLNPNVDEVVDQLYRQHPHILKVDKIKKQQIANIFAKIQAQLNMGQEEYEEEEFEEEVEVVEKGVKKMPVGKFNYDDDQQEGNPALNKSL